MKHFVRSVVLAGIFGFASTAALADNLILNGGFEQDLDHWTLGGGQFGAYGVDHTGTTTDGIRAFYFAAEEEDTLISQTISDITGHTIELSFWLRSDGDKPNDFDVAINGVYLMPPTYIPTQDWTHYVLTFTGSGSDTITFGGLNAPGFTYLDSVNAIDIGTSGPSPAATPEPSALMLCGTGLLSAARLVRRRLKAR